MKLVPLSKNLSSASVLSENDVLLVSTGEISRRWRLTPQGLATVSLMYGGTEWVDPGINHSCDWRVPGAEDCDLISITCEEGDDAGFTSQHLCVVAEFHYPASRIVLRHMIWIYPGAPGIRTQLMVRGRDPKVDRWNAATEMIPIALEGLARTEIGYFAGTQSRNARDLPLLQETLVTSADRSEHPWGSVLCLEGTSGGAALVKESHKCVNCPGHDSGGFICSPEAGVEVTGWGLLPSELRRDRFRDCWATWTILYGTDELARQASLKRFDKIRYPLDETRDVYILANTWGSSDNKKEAQDAARESNILEEIAVQADLGVDVQQIDDGWQGNYPMYSLWHPIPERYPSGWQNVRRAAAAAGVKLGLWAAAEEIPLEDLLWNHEHGGFLQYKLDFAHLESHERIEAVIGKCRSFLTATGQTARINWDLTENEPRFGYYFGRDLGCIYLANRKPRWPQGVIYVPWLMLRDLWHLAHYVNLGKFQGTIQNVDRTDRERSDAWRHGHGYSVAIALMSTPVFFQETHLLSSAAREEIRSLLSVYRTVRQEIYQGIVYPIGDEPTNASWTGFQCRVDDRHGYLMVFRELENREPGCRVPLRFSAAMCLRLQDLCSSDAWEVRTDESGFVEFAIDEAPGFRFMRYERT